MANEISVYASLKVVNGNLDFNYTSQNLTFDQTTQGGPVPGMISIGTIEESVTFGELGTLGWTMIKNLDATNYVDIGFSTGAYGIRLEAGEIALFRLSPGATMYLIANTAACKILLYAMED